MAKSQAQNGLFRRLEDSPLVERFPDEPNWRAGYVFNGQGFSDSPCVLENGTSNQHYRGSLEFIGET